MAQPEDALAALTAEEKRVMRLAAVGWDAARIAGRIRQSPESVTNLLARAYEKTGTINERGLALFYADHVLPVHTLPGYQPGELLDQWQAQADDRLGQLRASTVQTPWTGAALRVLSDPANATKTDAELAAALTTDPPVTVQKFRAHIDQLVEVLGCGNDVKLAVIARLGSLFSPQPR